MSYRTVIFAFAALSSLLLGGLAIWPRRSSGAHWIFAAGMLALAVENGAAYVLVSATSSP